MLFVSRKSLWVLSREQIQEAQEWALTKAEGRESLGDGLREDGGFIQTVAVGGGQWTDWRVIGRTEW